MSEHVDFVSEQQKCPWQGSLVRAGGPGSFPSKGILLVLCLFAVIKCSRGYTFPSVAFVVGIPASTQGVVWLLNRCVVLGQVLNLSEPGLITPIS